jgi:hypothetical protein
MVTVTVTGQREAKAAIQRLARLAPDKLKVVIAESTINVHREARKNAPRDVGLLANSITFEVNDSGLTGEVSVNSAYGAHVEFGTRPHFPPIQPLKDWARRHGLPENVGFLIARKIAERGTPAQPFLFPAAESERNAFLRAVRLALVDAAMESKTS